MLKEKCIRRMIIVIFCTTIGFAVVGCGEIASQNNESSTDQTTRAAAPSDWQFETTLAKMPLAAEIKNATDIVMIQITGQKPVVWTTVDGKVPPSRPQPGQTGAPLTPIEAQILMVYKGKFRPGANLTFVTFTSSENDEASFTRGERVISFTGGDQDYRAVPVASPLLYPLNINYYREQHDGSWSAPNKNTLTLPDLKREMLHPAPNAIPLIMLPKPAITPGQAVNIVSRYSLRAAQTIYVGSASHTITDSKAISAISAALDKEVVPVLVPSTIRSDASSITPIIFGFSDLAPVVFDFDRETSTLATYAPSYLQIPAPPNLAQLLGLSS